MHCRAHCVRGTALHAAPPPNTPRPRGRRQTSRGVVCGHARTPMMPLTRPRGVAEISNFHRNHDISMISRDFLNFRWFFTFSSEACHYCLPGLCEHQTSSESREWARILRRVSKNVPVMSTMLAEHQETTRRDPRSAKVTLSAIPQIHQK